MHHLEHLITFFLLTVSCVVIALPSQKAKTDSTGSDTKVLVLGGGVAGVIAARTLHEQGIDDFVLVEARDELGGRLQSTPFGGHVVELGANWIQGTQTGNGPINPIWTLAKKHGLETHISDFYRSLKTFDETGEMDFVDDVFNAADNNFDNYINYTQAEAHNGPRNAHEMAAEYMNFDWEYAQTPLQSSIFATARNSNFTFEPDTGGFSHDNMLSIDQRGYKMFIQQQAESFLKPQQLRLNTLVDSVEWSASGVKAVFSDGSSISADYAICTFSLGVLKNDDVKFEPDFPNYKTEAVATMTMGTYTKIYLQFPQKFWFDTEFALYADSERGRYPVWQSLDKEGFLPGSGIILVTVTGDYSERIEALSDTEVKEETMSVLRTMYPNITIPEPLDFKFHRWFNDPLYRGSFSNWPPSFVSQHHDNLRANVGRLYFAGEATSQNYYGYLHGAYFEGRDIANVVAKCVNGDSCVSLRRYEKY
ncbi:Polyamine oxidase [Termitomyces sp. J132]|nr:Polyamine oxidase [Termitomyces sp. J132]